MHDPGSLRIALREYHEELIIINIMSWDGCYEGPGWNVMVLPMDGPSIPATWNGCARPTLCCSGIAPTGRSAVSGPQWQTIRMPRPFTVSSHGSTTESKRQRCQTDAVKYSRPGHRPDHDGPVLRDALALV
jgi:hypothetical protein